MKGKDGNAGNQQNFSSFGSLYPCGGLVNAKGNVGIVNMKLSVRICAIYRHRQTTNCHMWHKRCIFQRKDFVLKDVQREATIACNKHRICLQYNARKGFF